MSLTEYLRKRSFDQTPEPKGSPAPSGGNRFYIQRHRATRLHYDLRLEIAGTLKSWAVPKGPTLDPAEKRLAVHVEDHPIEYGDFEGTIPAGNYGAGAVTVWDRGTYELLGDKPVGDQLARGDLKFRLHGQKLMGEFALVRTSRGKGNEWLLIKKKDFAATAGWDAEDHLESVAAGGADASSVPGAVIAAMPKSISPMLACIGETVPEGSDWLYELKWDGVRALCFVDGAKVRLVSRSGNNMDAQYPELKALPDYLFAQQAVLDGEIVVFDAQGRPDFGLLQPRMMAKSNAAALARANPVTLFLFDLLYLDGYDLRRAALVERKRLLASIVKPGVMVRYSEHFAGNGRQMLDFAQQHGLEGILAKRAAGAYEERRSRDWVKVKATGRQDFVVCGYMLGEREPFGSLVLGYYDGKKLRYAGNVGSGFDQRALDSVAARLKPLVTKKSPLVDPPKLPNPIVWTRPELVCSVKFQSWTRDGHLRAPVFLGIRPEGIPADCVREVPTGDAPKDGPALEARGDSARSHERRPPPLSPTQKEATLTIDGRRLKFTNLDKVFYPKEGYTKRDVINYYDAVAGLLLPHLRGRALSLKRYPDGIEGEYFFQKEAPAGTPEWLRTVAIPSDERKAPINYIVVDDRAGLLHLANLGCIDQNPAMSRVDSLDHPDFVLIDLDPVDCEYDRIVEAAQLVRQKLELLGLEGYPKTTGGDGMHIYVPLEPVHSFDQARTFAEIVARIAAAERPDLFTTPRTVARRERGKVYFDYLQQASGKTISAPYVLRAYPGAPVATPLAWKEVKRGLSPAQFTIQTAPERFARLGDLFAGVLTNLQRLDKSMEKLEEVVRTAAGK